VLYLLCGVAKYLAIVRRLSDVGSQ
jgi:hypothetical protein